MAHFYCQRLTGDVDFSIEEWNKQNKLCNDMGIEMPPDPPACKDQCFECMAIVGAQRQKTNNLPKLKLTDGSK
jgi:hypothetical protein